MTLCVVLGSGALSSELIEVIRKRSITAHFASVYDARDLHRNNCTITTPLRFGRAESFFEELKTSGVTKICFAGSLVGRDIATSPDKPTMQDIHLQGELATQDGIVASTIRRAEGTYGLSISSVGDLFEEFSIRDISKKAPDGVLSAQRHADAQLLLLDTPKVAIKVLATAEGVVDFANLSETDKLIKRAKSLNGYDNQRLYFCQACQPEYRRIIHTKVGPTTLALAAESNITGFVLDSDWNVVIEKAKFAPLAHELDFSIFRLR